MSTSRRTFLKSTIAGACVAVGDLRAMAISPQGAMAAQPLPQSQGIPPRVARPPASGEWGQCYASRNGTRWPRTIPPFLYK